MPEPRALTTATPTAHLAQGATLNLLWDVKPKVWREGWRNLHAQEHCSVRMASRRG